MTLRRTTPFARAAALLAALLAPGAGRAEGERVPAPALPLAAPQPIPNMGQQLTPYGRLELLEPDPLNRPGLFVGQAVTTAVSPDRRTLAVLTSGFNRNFYYDATGASMLDLLYSTEWVFVYDLSAGAPTKVAALRILQPTTSGSFLTNSYNGLAFDPSGEAIYASGGADDVVQVFSRGASGSWGPHPVQPVLPLGHGGIGNGILPDYVNDPSNPNRPTKVNAMVGVKPCAAGIALSADGRTLVVANYFNDSVSIFWGGAGRWNLWREIDLRPGKADRSLAGTPGGTYPYWVAVAGNGPWARAYVSSLRDREIAVVDAGVAPRVAARIAVKGQPNRMVLNGAGTRLYVVEDHTDTVDVIDTATNRVVGTIPLLASPGLLPAALAGLTGANPNAAALSPDERQLWVTSGNLNCAFVVSLDEGGVTGRTVGLVPTGWYPNSVSFGAPEAAGTGSAPYVVVVNGKSPTGPNPEFCYGSGPSGDPLYASCFGSNEYNPQLLKAGLQSFLLPAAADLPALTAQVAVNDRFSSTVSEADAALFAAIRRGVKHVVYVIKENRTYDQVLGDLGRGDGRPDLVLFGSAVTPNQHALARRFVTADRFLCTAEMSYDGWPWTTAARAPDVVEKQYLPAYAGRGLSLDNEGLNRSVNVSLPTLAERRAANPAHPADPDLLAGTRSVVAPDGPGNEPNAGYIWDAALRRGLSVRSYGFAIDGTRYYLEPASPAHLPLERDPYSRGLVVAYPTTASLAPLTDPYYRGFDPAFPDFYRVREFSRDFDARYGPGGADLPALTLVRLMANHTGSFSTAIDGVNTPELQVADNDYALGLLVEKIAGSRFASSTLIFVVEDDSQDGGDHYDSHRAPIHVIGPYVKRGVVVSTPWNTIDFVRTVEEVLDIPPMNLNDALAHPMADLFQATPQPWSFTAAPSDYLYGTSLPLPPRTEAGPLPQPTHDAAYWAEAARGMDFSAEDRFDFATYNRILWKGLKGDQPYPASSPHAGASQP